MRTKGADGGSGVPAGRASSGRADAKRPAAGSGAPSRALLQRLRCVRQALNEAPEAAGEEFQTAELLGRALLRYRPTELLTHLGGTGLAASFEGAERGPTVMVRCELDALRTEPEQSEAEHPEARVQHLCGHDGHMAIVLGLAAQLHRRPLRRGRVVLLFQPAEETGEGAQRVVDDPSFARIEPDFALALHNLPGFPRHSVVLRRGVFASASVGLRIQLEGASAHAAQPELGRSPAAAVGELLQQLTALPQVGVDGCSATITHAELGLRSFGLTPRHGEIWSTLRAATCHDLSALGAAAERLAIETARRHGLQPKLEWRERFPASNSDGQLVDLLEAECDALSLRRTERKRPFAWSDDFGVFSQRCASLYFGLGIGESAVPLHQRGYQFPDACIATGVRLFERLVTGLTAS